LWRFRKTIPDFSLWRPAQVFLRDSETGFGIIFGVRKLAELACAFDPPQLASPS
jgi:hypothetical protein